MSPCRPILPGTGGRRAATWAWLTSPVTKGPALAWPGHPPPAKGHPGAGVMGKGGTGTHWGGLCAAPSANPVPCPGRAEARPIFWVGMPRIPARGVLGAVAVSPPSALGPGGSLSAGAAPKPGSLGTRRWHGGDLPPAMGAAQHPGPFREVEEGEVPGGEQRHPCPPPISRRGAPAGFGVPIWDAAVAVRCWWGARWPRSYFGVFSPARIPPTGGAAVALCRSWVIFRAPAYILALSQSGWVAPPGTGERGLPWPDRGTAVAMWLRAEGGALVLWEAASLPLGRVFPPWMGSWAFWGAVLPPSAACR